MARRILRARKEGGLTQQAVATHFGISRAAVAQWESGQTRPETGKLDRLSQILNVRLEWLGTGREPIHPGDLDRTIAGAKSAVPVIDYIQAGRWSEVVDPYSLGDGLDFITTDLEVGGRSFALIIEGESMAPDFAPGDKVIVDPEVTPRPGDFVVAKLGNLEKGTFKKFRPRGVDRYGNEVVELVPLNDDWPILSIDAETPGRIVATMIEHRRYRRP